MAGYNDDRKPSSYRSRPAYNDDRNPTSYRSRPAYNDDRNPTGAGYTDDRNIKNYGEYGYNSDHVCRPVIVDAEGRKRPIISYGSPNTIMPESFVTTRTERIVEHVRVPVVVTDYNTYGSQARVDPLKEYGITNAKFSTTIYDRPESGYNSPTKMEPVRNEYGHNSPSKMEPVRNDYGHNSPSKREPVRNEYGHNSPSKMEPVRNDYGHNSPSKREPVRNEYGHNSPSKMEPARNYGVANDNWRGSSFNGGQDRPQKVEDFITNVQTEVSRPTRRTSLLSADLWRNPSSSNAQGYGATNGYGGEYGNHNNNYNNHQLSGPTNEIGKAVEMLKDSAKPSSIATIGPKRDSYTDRTIDSREAAKRYGNLNLASRPFQTGETYTGTIDSREAARRYGGARV